MERIIIDHEHVLKMLDEWMEKRDGEWWDHFYHDHARPIPFFSNVPDISLVKRLDVSKITPGRSLDIGCGNGRNTLYLAMQGWQATGIDISNEAIAWAKQLDSHHQAHYQCTSLEKYEDHPHTYDLILDSGCFHHIKPHRRQDYLTRIQTLLKADGYFLMTCFNMKEGAPITDEQVYLERSMHGGMGFTRLKLETILTHYSTILDIHEMEATDDPAYFGQDFLWVILMKQKEETTHE